MMRRLWARLVLVVALVLAVQPPDLRADQRDPRLDDLFEELEDAHEDRQASLVEGEIWRIWIDAGDPALDQLMSQGIGAMEQGRFDAALAVFDRLVEQAPAFAEAWNKRATVHYLLGNYEASVADIQKTLELEPRHFGALAGLGLIYDALGEPEAALRSFEAALSINPHQTGTRQRVQELRQGLRGSRI